MATYFAVARSDAFAVKDPESFLAWVATLPGVVAEAAEHTAHEQSRYLLLATDGEGWPSYKNAPDGSPSNARFNLYDELSDHLARGSVAVLFEAGGFPPASAVEGYAVAVNSDGEITSVNLYEIYHRIRMGSWDEEPGRARD